MGMSLAIASIPKVGVGKCLLMQKASKIHNMAFLCILLRTLKGYESGALLKYYN